MKSSKADHTSPRKIFSFEVVSVFQLLVKSDHLREKEADRSVEAFITMNVKGDIVTVNKNHHYI